jgi:EpsI family protein
MIGRLIKVEVVLLAGLSAVLFLPHASKTSPAGISMILPSAVGDWIGHDMEVTPREREVLAKDTQFARKLYDNLAGDEVYVSIVLSGEDMTNSIHRPERCLPAQGWNLESSTRRTVQIPGGKPLEVTRLVTERTDETDARGAIPRSLTYYWFVGYEDITASHLARTEIDLRDRILHGYNQRWAYVTVSAEMARRFARTARTEEETGQLLDGFIQQLLPELHKPDGSPLF